MSKIKRIEELDLKQRISNQTNGEMVPSIMKSNEFCVKLEVSLENKVYP